MLAAVSGSTDFCCCACTQALATAEQERDAAVKKLADTERRVVQMAKKRQAEHSAKVLRNPAMCAMTSIVQDGTFLDGVGMFPVPLTGCVKLQHEVSRRGLRAW